MIALDCFSDLCEAGNGTPRSQAILGRQAVKSRRWFRVPAYLQHAKAVDRGVVTLVANKPAENDGVFHRPKIILGHDGSRLGGKQVWIEHVFLFYRS